MPLCLPGCLAAAMVGGSMLVALECAAAGYDETVSGDLANDRLAPTPLSLTLGSNVVRGGYGNGDLDYFSITVPGGHVLESIVLGNGTVFGGTRSFIGVQAGAVMTVPPDAGSAAGLLGWTHFDVGQYGRDILPEIGLGFGSSQFVPPLPGGTYTFWVQETGLQPGLRFELDFRLAAAPPIQSTVPAVPVPGMALMAAMLALLGAALGRAKARRAHQKA